MKLELPTTHDYTFTDWLDSTALLQREAYGVDPRNIEPGTEQWAEFLRWNVLAAHAELSELLEECPIWKPWSTSTEVHHDRALIEAVDALHFVANILRLLDVTGEELTAVYKAKQQKNMDRQVAGYDGVKEKCQWCKRDLEEAGTRHVENFEQSRYETYCMGCGGMIRAEAFDVTQRGG